MDGWMDSRNFARVAPLSVVGSLHLHLLFRNFFKTRFSIYFGD